MSSTHTHVNCREWDERCRKIENMEAYVIRRKEEMERIAAETERIRREIENNRIENRQAIERTIDALANSFNENIGRLRGQVNTAIRASSDTFTGQIGSLRNDIANIGARLANIEQRINSIAESYNTVFQEISEKEQDRGARANLILSELNRLIGMMSQLDPQRFTPVEYARIISLRESIQTNINAGDYQAAIMVSQESILQATSLLARLQILNEEYNRRYSEVLERAVQIREQINRLSSKDGSLTCDLNGEKTEIDYDVSFWSYGRFDSVVSDFNHIDTALRGEAHTLEQLEQMANSLEVINDNIQIVDRAARRERLGAMATQETTIRLFDAMERAGMSLERGGYQNEDERNPYTLIMNTENGGTVSVVVSPESPESPSILMEVFSDDEYRAAAVKEGLCYTLEEDGIMITNQEIRDDCNIQTDPQTFIDNALAEAHEQIDLRRK